MFLASTCSLSERLVILSRNTGLPPVADPFDINCELYRPTRPISLLLTDNTCTSSRTLHFFQPSHCLDTGRGIVECFSPNPIPYRWGGTSRFPSYTHLTRILSLLLRDVTAFFVVAFRTLLSPSPYLLLYQVLILHSARALR